jgi:pilus assembly protein CpaB
MKMKSTMLLAIASGCGLLAMFLFQQAQGGTSQQEKRVAVLYCIAETTPGTQLDETNVEFREIPISLAPETAVTIPEDYKDKSTKVRLFSGDIVTLEKLMDGEGASGDIPEGMVAVPIPVDATMMLGGLLLPGDRVDVLVTYRSTNRLGKRIMTVLEFVEVFATDAKREIDTVNSESNTKTVTLLATQKEALLVKLAEDVGKLHLTLRSKEDKNPRLASADQKFKETDYVSFFNEGGDDNDDDDNDKQARRERVQAAARAAQAIDAASRKNTRVEPKPEVPTWKVEIFAGDTKRVDEFELPVVKKNTNPLLDTLNQMFGGSTKEINTQAQKTYQEINSQIPPLPVPANDGDQDNGTQDAGPISETPLPQDTGTSEPQIPFPTDR